jgi:hypothetical protein
MIKADILCDGETPIQTCPCGTLMEILWVRPSSHHIGIHPSDRAVVWYNPATGKHATPGRNDVPMPDRYKKAGYERKEFTTVRELDSFCKRNKLVNEALNYNKGNSYDGADV